MNDAGAEPIPVTYYPPENPQGQPPPSSADWRPPFLLFLCPLPSALCPLPSALCLSQVNGFASEHAAVRDSSSQLEQGPYGGLYW
jgi:hypothetical protein